MTPDTRDPGRAKTKNELLNEDFARERSDPGQDGPSLEEIKKAQDSVATYGDRMFPTGEDRAALCHASVILDAALRQKEAELAAANKALAEVAREATLNELKRIANALQTMPLNGGEVSGVQFVIKMLDNEILDAMRAAK